MLLTRGWAACRLLGKPEDGLSATKEGCAYFEKSLSDNPGDSLVMRAVLLAYAARDDALRGAVRNGIIGKKEGSKLATEYGWMALDLSSQAIELYPDNVSLYIAGTLAALIQLRTLNTYNGDRCDDAIAIGRKYFDKWILLDPKNISAVIQKSNVLMEIATVHLNAYQMEKARAVNLEALNNLRSTDSDDILEETYYAVFVQAGEIASKSGDWDKTAEYLDRLKKMNTTKYSDKEYELLDMRLRRFDRFFMASSLEEALGNWTEVEEQAKELISDSTEGLIKYPDTPFEWMPRRSIAEAQLGRALLRQGRFAESVKWLETALQDLYDSPPNWATAEDPDRLRSRMHRDLGEAFQSMEKWEEARNHYQIARRIHEEELEWCKPSIEFVVNSVDTLWKLASLPEETDDLSQPTAHRIELLRQARNLLENQDFKDREEPLPPEYSKLNAVINEEYQKLVTKEFVDAV